MYIVTYQFLLLNYISKSHYLLNFQVRHWLLPQLYFIAKNGVGESKSNDQQHQTSRPAD